MLRLGREVPYRGEVAMTVSSTAYALPTPDLVLDRYRPLRPLGRGGSGSVWLARDERTGLEVALKIVPREGKRASRAAREMEAASRLRHERCVRAYDFGGDSGHVYIAYEYVQGSTLRETLRSGKLGDRDAVEAAAQILDALAHAHRLGIVHRDVKPSNVLVEEAPTISIRLLDFGLAQFDEADTLTAVGDVPGTLAYIAPERLRGGDATAASDVWAVGVLLWEALVGEHPFWGVPLPQVAAAIEAGAKPIGTARPDVPPAIADAVDLRAHDRPVAAPVCRAARRRAANAPSPHRGAIARSPPRPRQATIAPKPAAVADSARASADPGRARGGSRHLRRRAAAVLDARARPAARARRGSRHDPSPAIGLAIALFVPVFPLGNVAQAAAVAYAASRARVARGLLARRTGRPAVRRGPGARPRSARIALLPLAVQPASGPGAPRPRRRSPASSPPPPWREFAAMPLPLTGSIVPNLGIDGTTRVTDVVQAIADRRSGQRRPARRRRSSSRSPRPCLPDARRRGLKGIAVLGVGQIALIVAFAPLVSPVAIVLGTCALCGVLAALSLRAGRYP